MTDEIVEFLVDHQFGVMASIDGPQEIHDRSRKFPNGNGSYSLVADNIKKLLNDYRDLYLIAVENTNDKEWNKIRRSNIDLIII